MSSFQFVACSGATTQSLADQLNALSRDTDLVTVTVGGNDIGFSVTVLSCLLGADQSCEAAVDSGTAKLADSLSAKLDSVYATIRARAPRAKVVVLGYPRLVEADAGTCLSQRKRSALNRGADRLDELIEARAHADPGLRRSPDR